MLTSRRMRNISRGADLRRKLETTLSATVHEITEAESSGEAQPSDSNNGPEAA